MIPHSFIFFNICKLISDCYNCSWERKKKKVVFFLSFLVLKSIVHLLVLLPTRNREPSLFCYFRSRDETGSYFSVVRRDGIIIFPRMLMPNDHKLSQPDFENLFIPSVYRSVNWITSININLYFLIFCIISRFLVSSRGESFQLDVMINKMVPKIKQ